MGDVKELELVLRSQGKTFSRAEVRELKQRFDMDGDGVIDYDEFIQLMADLEQAQTEVDELREAFMIFDKDKSGFIDYKELQDCLLTYCDDMTITEIQELLDYADKNEDGKIDY